MVERRHPHGRCRPHPCSLRGYARAHNRRLSDVARVFIDDSEALPGLVA
ncbi:hypothetical protein ACFWWT_36895 [Streptomyces sp. NPDC058676]